MSSSVKEKHFLTTENMECDALVDSGDSNETLTDEEAIEDEIHSTHVGVELIYFEHSYMKPLDPPESSRPGFLKINDEDILCELIENSKNQVPVRRSLRQINKSEKDTSVNNLDNSDHSPTAPNNGCIQENKGHSTASNNGCIEENKGHLTASNNGCIEENKESADSINNEVLTLNTTTNKDTDVTISEINLKNESVQSEVRKDSKRIKLSEVKVVLEKNSVIDSLKTSTKDFISVTDEKIIKKNYAIDSLKTSAKDFISVTDEKITKKSTPIKTKRKRTCSEPLKSDLSSSDVESVDKVMFKNKKKSRTKTKSSIKTKSPKKLIVEFVNIQRRRKRNLSAPSDETTKEDLLKNTEKSPVSKGRRKKYGSLSEDSTPTELVKSENKKNCFSENKAVKDISKLSSLPSNTVTKPKIKKIRKDSLRYVINENEPALFSQPDVMVKVKTDDGIKKEEKVQTQVNDSDNMPQVTDSVPKTDLCDNKIQEIAFPPTCVSSAPSPNNLPNVFGSEYSCQNIGKDNDSENSLQIDESVEKKNSEGNIKNSEEKIINSEEKIINSEEKIINSEENIKNSEIDLKENNLKNSIEKPKTDVCESLELPKFNEDISEEFNSNKHETLKVNMEDLDSDKPIAERKSRRIIKKKEFFEDITSKSSTQTRKSVGKQKGVEKKSTKEDSKQ